MYSASFVLTNNVVRPKKVVRTRTKKGHRVRPKVVRVRRKKVVHRCTKRVVRRQTPSLSDHPVTKTVTGGSVQRIKKLFVV